MFCSNASTLYGLNVIHNAVVHGCQGDDYKHGVYPNGSDGLNFRSTIVYTMGIVDPKLTGTGLKERIIDGLITWQVWEEQTFKCSIWRRRTTSPAFPLLIWRAGFCGEYWRCKEGMGCGISEQVCVLRMWNLWWITGSFIRSITDHMIEQKHIWSTQSLFARSS